MLAAMCLPGPLDGHRRLNRRPGVPESDEKAISGVSHLLARRSLKKVARRTRSCQASSSSQAASPITPIRSVEVTSSVNMNALVDLRRCPVGPGCTTDHTSRAMWDRAAAREGSCRFERRQRASPPLHPRRSEHADRTLVDQLLDPLTPGRGGQGSVLLRREGVAEMPGHICVRPSWTDHRPHVAGRVSMVMDHTRQTHGRRFNPGLPRANGAATTRCWWSKATKWVPWDSNPQPTG
jgi:hypothetical protein